MYIPTIFLGGQDNCIECQFSGSVIPDGVGWNKINSDWSYIKVPAGKQVRFVTKRGVSSKGKMLVVGGGGYSQANGDATGGGGAGQVVFKDFTIQPNIEYFASASIGGRSASQQGQTSQFIENYVVDPLHWIKHDAIGGDSNTGNAGGDSGDGFSGGTGTSTTAGGGGGGSTSAGSNGISTNGGDGGDGTSIPSPFDTVVFQGYTATRLAGGGPGNGSGTNGTWGTGVDPDIYGNGGYYASNNGKDGVVFIFLPISGCETGSREGLDFKAEGGSTGTFFSGSVQYKYHAFTETTSSIGGKDTFNVTQGITHEAKTLIVAGGAGSSTIEYKFVSGPDEYCSQIGGGAGAGGVRIEEDVTFWGHGNTMTIGEGGPRYQNGTNSGTTQWPTFTGTTSTGGGRGAYSDALYTPATGNANNGGSGGGGYNFVDNTGGLGTVNQGNDGGDGFNGGTTNQRYAGGGGGGASSTGSDAQATFDGAPLSQRYAKGGDGYNLDGTFWAFLTGSVFTSQTKIAIGGSGSAGVYDSGTAPHSCGTKPAGGNNGSQNNDGSGANPVDGTHGNDGIVVIAYPISGSVTNS